MVRQGLRWTSPARSGRFCPSKTLVAKGLNRAQGSMAAAGRPRSGREAPLTPSTVQASTGAVELRCVNTLAGSGEGQARGSRRNPRRGLGANAHPTHRATPDCPSIGRVNSRRFFTPNSRLRRCDADETGFHRIACRCRKRQIGAVISGDCGNRADVGRRGFSRRNQAAIRRRREPDPVFHGSGTSRA